LQELLNSESPVANSDGLKGRLGGYSACHQQTKTDDSEHKSTYLEKSLLKRKLFLQVGAT